MTYKTKQGVQFSEAELTQNDYNRFRTFSLAQLRHRDVLNQEYFALTCKFQETVWMIEGYMSEDLARWIDKNKNN